MVEPAVSALIEKRASYLELFFDLVFVFAITQVSALLHAKPNAQGLIEGGLLLFMLWWTWSLYTWTTNWTGTDRLGLRLAIIGAMGGSLLMAKSVPDAFGDGGPWFAWEYLSVRIFAGAIYWIGSRGSAPAAVPPSGPPFSPSSRCRCWPLCWW